MNIKKIITMLKNKNLAFAILLTSIVSISPLFALPGVTSTIQDQSGQFVYYQDTTFSRESYIGFAYYDEGTYGVRYFAPAFEENGVMMPSKNIFILFTMDIEKKYVELTGERILTTINPDDTDVINYIHDMLYELTAHRQKAGTNGIIDTIITVPQDFQQFGGDVNITYDPSIPLFNIRTIADSGNKIQFKLVTEGRITSSQDTIFSDFEGLPLKVEDNAHTLKLNKKAKKIDASYKKSDGYTQKIKLDDQWTANAENLYTMGNTAILAFDVISLQPQQVPHVERSFCLGTQGAFPYSENLKIEEKKNQKTFSTIYYNVDSKSFTRSFKVLTKLSETDYAVMTLTVFQGPYSRNSKYFDSILKSYSAD